MPGPVQVVSSSGSGTTLTTAITASSAMSCLVIYVSAFGDTSSPTTVTITSGTGGTGGSFGADSWTPASTSLGSAGIDAGIWADPGAAAGTNAVKVTTNGSGSQTLMVIIEEWASLALTSVVDATATPLRQSSGTTTWSVGPTGTTAQASEVVLGCAASFNSSGSSFTLGTPGSPWTEETQVQASSFLYYQRLAAGYQVVSSTGTFTYSGTAAYKTTAVCVTLKAAAAHPGTAALTGTGTLGGAGVFAGAGALSGTGTLSGTPAHLTSHGHGAAALSGSGTLGGAGTGVFIQVAALDGSGTLGGAWTATLAHASAALSGAGTLQLSGVRLGFTAGLAGNGTLSVLQATGGLVFASPGAATPYAYPLSSQVMLAPPGWKFTLAGGTTAYFVVTTAQSDSINAGDAFASSAGLGGPFTVTSLSVPFAGFVNVSFTPAASSAMSAGDVTETSARWAPLGSLGVVTALTYSFTCPGGADQMTATVMVPASYRNQYLNPGWQVKITRGGHQVWSGKLDEGVPGPSGWTLTASGAGNRGQDYLAIYSGAWPSGQPDVSINAAIARGLPWQNPGVGTPAGAWFGQQVDSGAQTVSGLLTLICTRGGLTWMVSSQPGGVPGDDLSVFPLPTVPNRLLACTQPVPRTLGGDVNTIVMRYQVSADTTDGSGNSVPAAFGTTTVTSAASIAAHQPLETSIDLSDVGTMTAAAVQAVGNQVLGIYQRASFAGPFTARYGQLTTLGGVPVDPGTDQAGTMIRLILTDYGYGGEVTPQFPVTFIVGSYTWDDLAQTATITPYQNVDQSLTGLLSLANTELTPVTVAGG